MGSVCRKHDSASLDQRAWATHTMVSSCARVTRGRILIEKNEARVIETARNILKNKKLWGNAKALD
jgi:hypothetical protein